MSREYPVSPSDLARVRSSATVMSAGRRIAGPTAAGRLPSAGAVATSAERGPRATSGSRGIDGEGGATFFLRENRLNSTVIAPIG